MKVNSSVRPAMKKEKTGMPKKSINSVTINCDLRNRSFNRDEHLEKGFSTHVGAVRSLRLWTLFGMPAFCFHDEYAAVSFIQPEHFLFIMNEV